MAAAMNNNNENQQQEAIQAPPVKIILVTGSVMSGVGKGIVSSSLGVLLKAHGYRVTAIKIDPYINVDAGTFSPFEHGEVFVLDDGGEVDLDLGNYERFLQVRLSRDNNITTGKIYQQVIAGERRGDYLGRTVRKVPHLTDAIIEWVERVARIPVDGSTHIPHLGGTIGDLEGPIYTKAFSLAFGRKAERNRFMSVHVTKILHEAGEIKTMPAQDGLEKLSKAGLQLDLLMCRSREQLPVATRKKVSDFSGLELNEVIDVYDCANLYKVPLLLHGQGVLKAICEQLQLPPMQSSDQSKRNMANWRALSEHNEKPYKEVKIALVAKYVNAENNQAVFYDAYASVIKALRHAAVFAARRVRIVFVNAGHLEQQPVENGGDGTSSAEAPHTKAWAALKQCQGILVPGGFGERGIEGKIEACRYARENKVPFLGICLGFQCAVIEFARNLCNIPHANSTEFRQGLAPGEQVVIDMPEHAAERHGMGATMRLGLRTTLFLTKDSILRRLYGDKPSVDERHRHRYEVNPEMVPRLSRAGLLFVGMGADGMPLDLSTTATTQTLADSPEAMEEQLLNKIEQMCVRKGDGIGGTAIRMEMAEMKRKEHPYFVGVQYHPEFLSSPFKPSPPFFGLLLAASGQLDDVLAKGGVPSPVVKLQNPYGLDTEDECNNSEPK